jgi:hypothetical protein
VRPAAMLTVISGIFRFSLFVLVRRLQIVIAGHSRLKDGVASARLCPAIHHLKDGYAGQARV